MVLLSRKISVLILFFFLEFKEIVLYVFMAVCILLLVAFGVLWAMGAPSRKFLRSYKTQWNRNTSKEIKERWAMREKIIKFGKKYGLHLEGVYRQLDDYETDITCLNASIFAPLIYRERNDTEHYQEGMSYEKTQQKLKELNAVLDAYYSLICDFINTLTELPRSEKYVEYLRVMYLEENEFLR